MTDSFDIGGAQSLDIDPRKCAPTTEQLILLNAMSNALIASNAIERWAVQEEGYPYFHLHEAMRAALMDIYQDAFVVEAILEAQCESHLYGDVGQAIALAFMYLEEDDYFT